MTVVWLRSNRADRHAQIGTPCPALLPLSLGGLLWWLAPCRGLLQLLRWVNCSQAGFCCSRQPQITDVRISCCFCDAGRGSSVSCVLQGLGRVVTQSQVSKARESQAVQQLDKPQAEQQAILKVRIVSARSVHTSHHGNTATNRLPFVQTFELHIGASLPVPTDDKRKTHRPEPLPGRDVKAGTVVLTDPFAGLPFRSLAERLGANMAPAIENMRTEQRRARAAGHAAANATLELPPVPHLLPFTRW